MEKKKLPDLPGLSLDDMPDPKELDANPGWKAMVIALLAVQSELRLLRMQGEAMSEIAGIQLEAIKAMQGGGIVRPIVMPGTPGQH